MNRREDMNLEGKVAIVTGASRGIGEAIAVRLHAAGASLALVARNSDALAKVQDRLQHIRPNSVSVYPFDLAQPQSAQALFEQVHASQKRIDVLVNNAGGGTSGSFLQAQDADWEADLAAKLFGGMRLARACWPELKASQGSLINIVGVAGKIAPVNAAISATQCAGYNALTRSMAQQGLLDGVQVNAINPGPVWTDRLRSRLQQMDIDPLLPEKTLLRELANKLKVKRIALPEDIANLVAFILSGSGEVFHGAVIDFDAGATLST